MKRNSIKTTKVKLLFWLTMISQAAAALTIGTIYVTTCSDEHTYYEMALPLTLLCLWAVWATLILTKEEYFNTNQNNKL